MLVQIDGNGDLKDSNTIPHQADFARWRAGLTDAQHEAIQDEIERRIGDKEVNVSSFIPGADWTGTPFWPIYDSACNRDFDAARKFFGLLVWEYLKGREDTWSFGRYDIRGIAVEGMVYFRVNR